MVEPEQDPIWKDRESVRVILFIIYVCHHISFFFLMVKRVGDSGDGSYSGYTSVSLWSVPPCQRPTLRRSPWIPHPEVHYSHSRQNQSTRYKPLLLIFSFYSLPSLALLVGLTKRKKQMIQWRMRRKWREISRQ